MTEPIEVVAIDKTHFDISLYSSSRIYHFNNKSTAEGSEGWADILNEVWSATQHTTAPHTTTHHSTPQHITAYHTTSQHSTTHHIASQHTTIATSALPLFTRHDRQISYYISYYTSYYTYILHACSQVLFRCFS